MCQWSGIFDAILRKSCILSESKRNAQRAITERLWLWFEAKLSHQLGATLGPR
jgi:hypothetical protein